MTEQHEHDNISLIVGGDFAPDTEIFSSVLQGDFQTEIKSFQELLESVDVKCLNLECPLTGRGEPIEKSGPNLRVQPEAVRLLKSLQVDVVTLATNHMRDFGAVGLRDTLDICAANGIHTVGAGMHLADANRPLLLKIRGRTLAIINVCEPEVGNGNEGDCAINNLELVDLLRQLREVRKVANHVLLVVHGGLENTHLPSPESVRLLRFLAEQQVTAIVRHHSHYVQGFEIWQGVPIFYGLGNFLFNRTDRSDEGWHNGLLVALVMAADGGGCHFALHPVRQTNSSPNVELLIGEEKEKQLSQLNKHSSLLSNPKALELAWTEELKNRRSYYFNWMVLQNQLLRKIFSKLGLANMVRPGRKFRVVLENLFRCPAHREVVCDILRQERR